MKIGKLQKQSCVQKLDVLAKHPIRGLEMNTGTRQVPCDACDACSRGFVRAIVCDCSPENLLDNDNDNNKNNEIGNENDTGDGFLPIAMSYDVKKN